VRPASHVRGKTNVQLDRYPSAVKRRARRVDDVRAMRLRVNEPVAASELAAALSEEGCDCFAVSAAELEVNYSAGDEQARLELTFFVRAWLLDRPLLSVSIA
jgi:hypothetical protein